MAFRISASPSYTCPVRVTMPTDGGRKETYTFDAEFKRLEQDRIRELILSMQRFQRGEPLEGDPTDVEAAAEILIGWDGIEDDGGKPIPFSEKARDQLLQLPFLASQILGAWAESHQGAKRKN